MRIETIVRVKPSESDCLGIKETSVGSLEFSRVFGADASTRAVFAAAIEPLLASLTTSDVAEDGLKSACVAAYGVSNGGKTHTIYGSSNESKGLLPLSLDWLFGQLAPVSLPITHFYPSSQYCQVCTAITSNIDIIEMGKWSVWLSAVEVYNDKIFDLSTDDRASLVLKHANQSTQLEPLKSIQLLSSDHAQQTLNAIRQRRRVYGTQLNASSSRSHLIIYLHLIHQNSAEQFDAKRMVWIDLAGTERQKHTQATNERLKETGWIHQSLSALRHCLAELKERRPYVSFRNSKLTQILQPDLQPPVTTSSTSTHPSSKSVFKFFVMVDPSEKYKDETMHTLETACLASKVDLKHVQPRIDSGMSGTPRSPRIQPFSPSAKLDGLKKKLFQSPLRVPVASSVMGSATRVGVPSRLLSTALQSDVDSSDAVSEYSSTGNDSSFIHTMAQNDAALRQTLLEEHLQHTESLRQEYESMLTQTVQETEDKMNRKLELLARAMEKDLEVSRRECDLAREENRKLRDENAKLILMVAQLQDELESLGHTTVTDADPSLTNSESSAKNKRKKRESDEAREAELTHHIQQILESSQRELLGFEVQMHREVRAVKEQFHKREKERVDEMMGLKNEITKLKRKLADSEKVQQMSVHEDENEDDQGVKETTADKRAMNESGFGGLSPIKKDKVSAADQNASVDVIEPNESNMNETKDSVDKLSLNKNTMEVDENTNQNGPTQNAPVPVALSPMLSQQGRLKGGFRATLVNKPERDILAAKSTSSLNTLMSGSGSTAAGELVKKKKRLRPKKAVFGDDDEDD